MLSQGSPLYRELPRPRTEQDLGGDATFTCTLRAVSAGDNNSSENAKVNTNSWPCPDLLILETFNITSRMWYQGLEMKEMQGCLPGLFASPAKVGLSTGYCIQRGNVATDIWTAPVKSTMICPVNALGWEERNICCGSQCDKDLVEIHRKATLLPDCFELQNSLV